ncbi:MAG TPA: transcription elongation factor GreA [bacterium]|nr:transcription elongation factor GreA [bacterium]
MLGKQTYITLEGLEKLKQELLTLKNIKRKDVLERIQIAKEYGDLSENAEYADARDEQAFIEGRIAELEEFMKNAIIIKEQSKNISVNIGSVVKIKDKSNKTVKEYEIVGSQESDPLSGKISNESPLGKAFLGHKVGEVVSVSLPKGVIEYEIVEIR